MHRGTPASQPAAPSTAEREHVVELLSQHFAQDGISVEEFEHRLTLVYAAPDRAALQALVSDLQHSPDPGGARSGALLSPDDVPIHDQLRVVMSSIERSGPVMMPRHLTVSAFCGDLKLDLRSAVFSRGVTVIEVRGVMSNVEITVLPDVPVEIVGSGLLGAFNRNTRHAMPSASPQRVPMLLRVSGRAVLANVEVRHAAAAEQIDGW
jgi:hypothetical protein